MDEFGLPVLSPYVQTFQTSAFVKKCGRSLKSGKHWYELMPMQKRPLASIPNLATFA
jgi:hypothetical protein